MNQLLLSVIVPVYNTAPWLARCLDSICAQSYRNLEILCVNDGSTDHSAEILAEYAAKDARIKVFTQANAGLSAARNTALEHATGEWVTGVDSDDYLFPGIYEQAVKCCREGVDMVVFGVEKVPENGGVMPQGIYFKLPESGEYEMNPSFAMGINVCFWNKFWRRSMLEENKLRFPVGLVHEDEALYYLAAPYIRNVSICPYVGYAYLQREGSIMNDNTLDALRKLRRYIQIVEYVHEEYCRRGLRNACAGEYLVVLFKGLCACYYCREAGDVRAQLKAELSALIKKCDMQKAGYYFERMLPPERKCGMVITRYPRIKLYSFLGIPVWFRLYSLSGEKITIRNILSWVAKTVSAPKS